MKSILTATCLMALALSGCMDLLGSNDDPFDRPLSSMTFEVPDDLTGDVEGKDITWPDLKGANITILSHGAFYGFDAAAARFKELTGAVVTEFPAEDTGSALNRALREAGDSQYDILYGIDNTLMGLALNGEIFLPYEPALGARIPAELQFVPGWQATAVDHGYIAINVDADHELLDRASEDGCASLDDAPEGNFTTINDLADVRALSCLFVTQNPNLSTPGLGFLLITIDQFGEGAGYNWESYWQDLFLGPDAKRCTGDEVRITDDWTSAYQDRFTAGYGERYEMSTYKGGYPIVTSYTTSPAYEWSDGADTEHLAQNILADGATFHQIQTMGILDGTKNLAVAQAWMEFTLTDDFQKLAAPKNAVYPIVPSVGTDGTYGDIDPAPGTFTSSDMGWEAISANLEGWLETWTDLYQDYAC